MLNEYTIVEQALVRQLQNLGWDYLKGDIDVPYLTGRESFREVLLQERLRAALRRINTTAEGEEWLDDVRVNEAVSALERIAAPSLVETNRRATRLLLKGTVVPGHPDLHAGREQTIHYIDWQNPENNDFLVINQFRVDPPWAVGDKDFIIPDAVLFVNGIPLVVVEAKSPAATDPIASAITDLHRYTNQREEVQEDEGAERLFWYNQLLVATSYYDARTGTISSKHPHFLRWKEGDPATAEAGFTSIPELESGFPQAEEEELARRPLQPVLAAGILQPARLLDLVRHFTLFKEQGGQRIKIVARYQQWRAVQAAVERLRHGQTRLEHGDSDQRGGIIWHTQGSGKSLTMVFLVRKLRTEPDLRRFKVVAVTDRQDLEDQLTETAALAGETIRTAHSTDHLQAILREPGPDLIFAMIQKYQEREEAITIEEVPRRGAETAEEIARLPLAAEARAAYTVTGRAENVFPVLNESTDILVLVDEAHRSHSNTLHANLMRALPNCAKIGFTGTPIIIGQRKRTHEIFGPFIDKYTIRQSEADGMTVPILYEGRTTAAEVSEGRTLDQLFEDMFRDYTEKEREAIKQKYATEGDVLESEQMIAAKARDMLRHYVTVVLPEGFKAQVVGVSRKAAVRYQRALSAARDELIGRLESLDPALLNLSAKGREALEPDVRWLVEAHPHLDAIRRLEAAAVISSGKNDPPKWNQWSRRGNINSHVERFKRPLHHEDPAKQDGLAFLCINRMLLTGFDAPLEQVLYLDRGMRSHELLQAIARVNRTAPGKQHGLVVDYYGVAQHLREALDVYTDEDVEGALTNIRDELPVLEARHRRVMNFFAEHGIDDIYEQLDQAVMLLEEERLRAEFVVKLKQFLASLNIVLPRPEALPYVDDAKVLGFINKTAANLFRDDELNIHGVGNKVQALIDEHVRAEGVNPTVPPISILDADFDEAVNAHTSDRARAAEMEHAARHHISRHYREDPVYYQKLSERLEQILEHFEGNWEQLVEALRRYTEDVREGAPTDDTGLDPETQAPFLRVLVDEVTAESIDGEDGELPEEELQQLAGVTVEMVDHIRKEIGMVDFWRNTVAQNDLRGWLVRYLDRESIVPLARLEAVADQIVEIAKARHTRLTKN